MNVQVQKLQKPNILYQPNFVTFIILVLAAFWVFFPGWPGTLAFFMVGLLFLFGLKQPVWALGAFLVSQFTITSQIVDIAGFDISLRLLLLLLTSVLLLLSKATDRFDLGPKAKTIAIPLVVLIALTVVSNMIHSGFDFAFRDFRNWMVGLLIIILIPAITGNVKHLRTISIIVLIIVSASAIVGALQHFNILGAENSTLWRGFLGTWNDDPRVPGMAETELELSYALSSVIPVILGVLLAKGIKNPASRWLIAVSLVIMLMSLYFTYTRSALFALGIAFIALFLLFRTRINTTLILVATLIAIVLIETTGVLAGQYFSGRSETGQEESSISRKILWQAGVAIAMDNPALGIGGDNYSKVATDYQSSVDADLIAWENRQYWGYQTLGNEAIHNDFLNVWVSYGAFALLLYLWLFIAVLHSCIYAFRHSKNRFIRGLSIGLAAALFAYATNSFYHNILATFSFFFILAGLSLALVKLTAKKNETTPAQPTSTS